MTTEYNTNIEQIININEQLINSDDAIPIESQNSENVNDDINSEISDYDENNYFCNVYAIFKQGLNKIENDDINNDDKCAICSDIFIENTFLPIIKTSCSHIFHEECINDWFVEGSDDNCPVCRKEFTTEIDIKPEELLINDDIKKTKNINLIFNGSMDFNCDFCCDTIQNNRHHLRTKNYDLCDMCWDIMVNAYNNKIDYKTLILPETQSRWRKPKVDKNFDPKNYIYFCNPKYELNVEYDQLRVHRFIIDHHDIKTKKTLTLGYCRLNHSKLQSNKIKLERCTFESSIKYNTNDIIISNCNTCNDDQFEIYSDIYQGHENLENFELYNIKVIKNISVPVKNITFGNLQNINFKQDLWFENILIIKLLDGKYDFGPNIEYITIINVKFKQMPLFGTKLKKLTLNNAVCETISELNLVECTDLKLLSLQNIYVDKITGFGDNLENIDIYECNLKQLPDKLPQNIELLEIVNQTKLSVPFDYFNINTLVDIKIKNIDITEIFLPKNISNVAIRNSSLKKILNERLPDSLLYLCINNCKLESVPEFNDNIQNIELINNKLTKIPKIPKNVERLYLTNNLLTEINMEDDISTREIDLSKNKLTKFIISNKNIIQFINLSHNKLIELVINDINNIGTLNINYNKLTSFCFNGKINNLKCKHNQLSTLIVDKITYRLDCSYNNLKYLDHNFDIIELDCSHNKNLANTLMLNGSKIQKLNIVNTQIQYILTNNLTYSLIKFRYNKDKLLTNLQEKSISDKKIYCIETILGHEKRLLHEQKINILKQQVQITKPLDKLNMLFGQTEDDTEHIIDVNDFTDNEYDNITHSFGDY